MKTHTYILSKKHKFYIDYDKIHSLTQSTQSLKLFQDH